MTKKSKKKFSPASPDDAVLHGEDLEENENDGGSAEEYADHADVEVLPAFDDDDDFSGHDDDALAGGEHEGSGQVFTLEPLPESRYPVPKTSSADSLYNYLKEVNAYPMLAPDEEFSLARNVRDCDDTKAALKLVTSHLRLVVKIAMEFQRRFKHGILDLIQEGNIGLMRAARKFDPDKGIKFSYYAKFWIKAYILKYIMDNWRMVKIGTTQAQRKMFYNLNRERQKLLASGQEADSAALAKNLNLPENQVVEMEQRMNSADQSLDVGLGGEGTASKLDFLASDEAGVEETTGREEVILLLREEIGQMLSELSSREKDILRDRLLTDEPMTLQELGQKYNITRERVRQIESRLLDKIRGRMEKKSKGFSEDWIQPAD